MATRKDLLKAHAFVTQRLKAALVSRRPDDAERPLRRLGTGLFASVMIGVLITAGFGVVGLVRGGTSTSWQDKDHVIVNSETGAVFAYLAGELYPASNITSAKLATGGAELKKLKSRSLRGFPEQNPIGIEGAPKQLPDPKSMGAYPLRVCSTAPDDKDQRFTTLEVGAGDVPDGNATFAARDSSGEVYLIVNGRAHPVPTPEGSSIPPVLSFLGFNTVVEPGDRFLNTLPAGSPLEALDIPKFGEQSVRPPNAGSTKIGSLFHVEGATTTYYVLLEDGLAEIAPLESAVLAAEHDIESTPISAAEAARVIGTEQISKPDVPRTLPEPDRNVADPSSVAVCASWPDADSEPRLALAVDTPEAGTAASTVQAADVVVMPTLHGALVTAESGDTAILVTESKRFGIASDEDRGALGYGELTPERIPTAILTLIPEGLDPGLMLSKDAALQPVGR
ncbi:type VII secretion protein EccB [Enemella sp. A6]|uniref:type VII secretion protein EccB n=1 Tax=Enemella sp. A6 TaxID=3440152 RepID=UPI003EBF6802